MKKTLFILLVLLTFIFVGCVKDPVTYTVEFDSQGGNLIPDQTVVENEKVTKPKDPTKEGYTFLGWFNGEELFNFELPVESDIQLTAKWNKDLVTYTVTFNSDGGTTVSNQTINENEKVTKPTDPVKEGYTFLGWYIGDNKFDFDTLIATNLTLTAKWEQIIIINKYTVTFNSNGGTVVNNQTVNENEKVTKPTDPQKEGYNFIGWFDGESQYDFNTLVTTNITLTAKWEEVVVSYTVTFNSDGGTLVENQTIKQNEKVIKPTDPTKEGYIFLGWYEGLEEFDFGKEINANIALIAKWEKIVVIATYTITFDSNGGSLVENQMVKENEKVVKPQDPIKEGYIFMGWFDGDDKFDFNDKVTSNIKLTAKWEEEENSEPLPIIYTVTFNSDGGSIVNNQTINDGQKAVKPQDPTKAGFKFLGWFDGDIEFDFNTLVTRNITLVAKWEEENNPEPLPTVYTVTFNSDGGSIVSNQNVNENDKVIKPVDPTKDGYTFIGWYIGENEYDFDQVVTSSFELTAKWEEVITIKTFSVTFNSDGGTIVSNQVVNENEKVIKPANPTKDGYTFVGWYLGEEEYNFDSVVITNITLVAKWEEVVVVKTFTVTFNSDGGTIVSNQVVNENEKVNKPSDPEKTGYIFKGWYNGDTEFDFNTVITENITLTAMWEKKPGSSTGWLPAV